MWLPWLNDLVVVSSVVIASTLSSLGSECPFGQKVWKGVLQNGCSYFCQGGGTVNDITLFIVLTSAFKLSTK